MRIGPLANQPGLIGRPLGEDAAREFLPGLF
jgi:hypothetical protein